MIESRRMLIEETKKFRQLDSTQKMEDMSKILKLYHSEIDALAIKCRARKNAIQNLQSVIEESRKVRQSLKKCTAQCNEQKHEMEFLRQAISEKGRSLEELKDELQTLFRPANEDSEMKVLKREYSNALSIIESLKVLCE